MPPTAAVETVEIRSASKPILNHSQYDTSKSYGRDIAAPMVD